MDLSASWHVFTSARKTREPWGENQEGLAWISCLLLCQKEKKKPSTKHSQNKHCGNIDSCHWLFQRLLYSCCKFPLSSHVFSRLTPTFDGKKNKKSKAGKVYSGVYFVLHRSVFTWLHHPRLGPQVGQVDVGLPAVDDWVGVLAGSVCRRAVRHRHLTAEGETRRGWGKCGTWNRYVSEIPADKKG